MSIMENISVWIDAASKLGVPAVFAFILLLKVLPALEKVADSLAFVGERLARIESEADIKPRVKKAVALRGAPAGEVAGP
jgi:hypothetical protein